MSNCSGLKPATALRMAAGAAAISSIQAVRRAASIASGAVNRPMGYLRSLTFVFHLGLVIVNTVTTRCTIDGTTRARQARLGNLSGIHPYVMMQA